MSEQDTSENFEINDFSCHKILQEIKNSSSKEFQLNWIIKHLEEKIYLERELNEISLKYNNLIFDFDQFKNQIKNQDKFQKSKATKKVTVKNNQKPSTSRNKNLATNIKKICGNVQKIYDLISSHVESKKPTSNVSVQTEFNNENFDQFKRIDICEHNLEKKFIRLTNCTNFEMKLGNFQLISYLNGFEIAKFKFHKSAYLKPNSSLTLWSSYSSFKRHYPPNDLEMENDQMNDENIYKLASMVNFDGNVWDVLLDSNNNVSQALIFLI